MHFFFSINYCYSDILLKKSINLIYHRLFCCNHTCYCVNMVSVTTMSRSHLETRSSMYIRGLIPRNLALLVEAVPVDDIQVLFTEA